MGQEIYGAGLAFGLLTSLCFRTLDESLLIYIDYPIQTMTSENGILRLSVSGDKRLDCKVCIIPAKGKTLPEVYLECTPEGTSKSVKPGQTKEAHQLFRLKGDCEIALSWAPTMKKEKTKTKSTKT